MSPACAVRGSLWPATCREHTIAMYRLPGLEGDIWNCTTTHTMQGIDDTSQDAEAHLSASIQDILQGEEGPRSLGAQAVQRLRYRRPPPGKSTRKARGRLRTAGRCSHYIGAEPHSDLVPVCALTRSPARYASLHFSRLPLWPCDTVTSASLEQSMQAGVYMMSIRGMLWKDLPHGDCSSLLHCSFHDACISH